MIGDPGNLLRLFRERKGIGATIFADKCHWSYDTQHRLETGKTPFKRGHLNELVAAGWFETGDEWFQMFEDAIAKRSASLLTLTYEDLHSVMKQAVDIALKNLLGDG